MIVATDAVPGATPLIVARPVPLITTVPDAEAVPAQANSAS